MNNILATLYLTLLVGILSTVAFLLSQQISKRKKIDTYFNILKQKIAVNKINSIEYYTLGTICLSKKYFDQAILYFACSLKNWDKTDQIGLANVYNAIGVTYCESNQLDMSIYYYEEAIALVPEYIDILKNLGYCYEKKKLFQKAITTYFKIKELNKNDLAIDEKILILKKKLYKSG
jgi:tetratricopeptide (TPR) repeat protein